MTGFLLAISFILHLLTLLAIVIVWKKSEASEKQDIERVKREMEDILLAYSTEMKEENEAFLKELETMNTSSRVPLHSPSTSKTNDKPKSKANDKPKQSDEREVEDNDYTPPIIDEKEQFGPSLLAEVLSLQKKGYTLDEIAKKLDKGKGEVELLIKFYQDRQ